MKDSSWLGKLPEFGNWNSSDFGKTFTVWPEILKKNWIMGELWGCRGMRGLERSRSCGYSTKSSGGASKHPQIGLNTSKALIPVSHWEFLSSLKDLFLLLSLIPKALEGSGPSVSSLSLPGLREGSRNKKEEKWGGTFSSFQETHKGRAHT